jgi:hypothetical protein
LIFSDNYVQPLLGWSIECVVRLDRGDKITPRGSMATEYQFSFSSSLENGRCCSASHASAFPGGSLKRIAEKSSHNLTMVPILPYWFLTRVPKAILFILATLPQGIS